MKPEASIIYTFSSDRLYLQQRTMAHMEAEFRGLDLEFVPILNDAKPWNECKGKNLGARHATSDLLIFTNCDIIIPRHTIQAALKHFQEHPRCVCGCIRLDEQADGLSVVNRHALGDFQAIPKEVFWEVGGFDERMTGWGYLDYDLFDRIQKIGVPLVMLGCDCTVTHCWHPRLSDEEYRAMNKRNREIALCET